MNPFGPFGNMMPYTNYHGMNLDWVIQIAKDFLDQYTTIQSTIDTGLTDLQAKYDTLEGLLDAWYTEHSEDIANDLRDALEDLSEALTQAITDFGTAADAKAAETIATIPEDYSALSANVTTLQNATMKFRDIGAVTDLDSLYVPGWYILSSSDTYTNTPEGISTSGQRIVIIRGDADAMTNNHFRHMQYYNFSNMAGGHRVYATGEWSAWKKDFTFGGDHLTTGADLNNYGATGWYVINSDAVVTNGPETATGQRLLVVYPSESGSSIKHQMYYNYASGMYAHRLYVSGAWNNWKPMDVGGMKFIQTLTDGTDLNDLYQNGWYNSGYSHNYAHSPEPSGTIGQRLITIRANTKNPSATTWRIMTYLNMRTGVSARRIFVSGNWESWTYENDREGNTPVQTYNSFDWGTPVHDNVGLPIRVMSYNVSRYNNDTSTYISDQKITNFLKMLGHVNADIIGTQEDTEFIDSNSAHYSSGYLYYPVYPANANGNGTYINCLRSKKTPTSQGRIKYNTGANAYRSIQYAVYNLGEYFQLLAISTHANYNDTNDGADSAANIARRLAQYGELFDWIMGRINLKDYDTNADISVPSFTHCVIMMDANTVTDTDKTNLLTEAIGDGFIPCNGGRLGWFGTENVFSTPNCYDNIIVSDNIIINNTESLWAWGRDLYSTHVPLIADLTLVP